MTWTHHGTAELDAQSTYPTVLGVCIAVPVFMTLVVLLRAYTRCHIVRSFWLDDYFTFVAAIMAICYAGLCISQTRLGLGLPPDLRPPEDLPEYAKQNFAGRPFHVVAIAAFKLALCVSYLRFTDGSDQRPYRIVIWLALAYTVVYNLAYLFTILFNCSPVARSWNYEVHGHCIPVHAYYYTTGVLTVFNDLVLFFLPIPLVWQLHMNKRTKFGLTVAFLFGLLTTFCSIMRIVSIRVIDKTGNTTEFIMWGVAESCVGTITTSIPPLRPLLRLVTEPQGSRTAGYVAYETKDRFENMDSVNLGSISSDGAKPYRVDTYLTRDKESDWSPENILPLQGARMPEYLVNAITVTRNVEVSSSHFDDPIGNARNQSRYDVERWS